MPEYDSRQMTVGGIISSVRTIITKSGSKMAFVALEDKFGEGEVIVFPNLFEQHGAKIIQDTIVTITGVRIPPEIAKGIWATRVN